MKSLLVDDIITGTFRGAKFFVEKTAEHPTNKIYPVEYFNEFTIPEEEEKIRRRRSRDIKRGFCN